MLKNKIILFSTMIQTFKHTTASVASLAGFFCFLLLTACSSDPFDNTDSSGDAGNTIKIGAFMSEYLHSRADMGMVQVVDSGVYCLSYPMAGSGAYRNAIVNFGLPEFDPSIGVVTVYPNSELTWNNIWNVSRPTFYLDNIPIEKSSVNDPSSVIFNDQYNPFVAGLYDQENGSNDLLWGAQTETGKPRTINFDLHHNMARLKVKITVDKTNEAKEGDLDLTDAVVEITSLVKSPVSYDRLEGTLALSDTREALTLVDLDENLDWESKIQDSANDGIWVYTTKDFVLPPQGLPEDTSRPMLEIRLKNGTTYSGILPYAMEVVDDEHPDPYPMTLYFLKEHILTIHTLITEEPPQLEFMPVQVVDWVYKGEFSFDGHQSGLYTANEFYNFIRDYNAGNSARLERYGVLTKIENLDTDIWDFQFWNSVVLDYLEIYNKIQNPVMPFYFSFNGFQVSVLKDNNTIVLNASQLYDILTGASSL